MGFTERKSSDIQEVVCDEWCNHMAGWTGPSSPPHIDIMYLCHSLRRETISTETLTDQHFIWHLHNTDTSRAASAVKQVFVSCTIAPPPGCPLWHSWHILPYYCWIIMSGSQEKNTVPKLTKPSAHSHPLHLNTLQKYEKLDLND